MLLEKVSFADTHSFSSFFLDYIQQKESLRPFYHRFAQLENFKDQIKEKSAFSVSQRKILTDTLQNQYKGLATVIPVKNNIESLSHPNTFTITTGHQLNVFTGPLYFIYKIVTIINACRQLKAAYPDYHFVPVYWMASEDHDFEEISYFHLYGKKYTWETDQRGAVGRFSTEGLDRLMAEIPGDIKIFRGAYAMSTLSEAVRFYVNELFGAEGLVVINADDRVFKNALSDVIQDDLFNNTARQGVDECTAQLETLGYKTNVNARDINFFYLDTGIRNRIEKDGEDFKVIDSPLHFTKIQMMKMIKEEPEKFSPNVILRPLYQELILPNLAYVGGPAEVCYWLQLKSVFTHYQLPFPVVMPRNFALVMTAAIRRKFEKTGLEIKDFFEEKNFLFNHWVVKNTHDNLTLSESINAVQNIFADIKARALKIDKTLGPLVSAETKEVLNRLEKVEGKFLKAERRRQGDKLRQIEVIKESLFPENDLQERHDNFLTFYQQDPEFIQKIIDCFDPFDFRFNAVSYHDQG